MAIESMNAAGIAASSVQPQSTPQTSRDFQPSVAPVQSVAPSASAEDAQNAGGQDVAEQLEAVTERLNELMNDGKRSLAFSVDKELDQLVVKVVDTNTDEVIRQIPNEQALKFAKNLEGALGVIFNETV